MSNKLKIHLEAYNQGKEYAVKVVKVLTGSTKKEAEELVKKAPVDFDVSGNFETIRALLREAGAVGTVTDSSGQWKPIQEPESVPGRIETEPGGDEPSGAEEAAPKEERYMSLFLPSLASKRSDAVLALQDVLGIERWEAEIYVDKTPLQLTFDKKDRADLLTNKLGALGFLVNATIPPVFYDQGIAKKTDNDIQGKKDDANRAIDAIQDAYNQIVPLVTLSNLVSVLVVKETSINLEAAENNYQKLQSILGIAEAQQDKASAVFKELLSIKESAYEQLVSAQSNGAIDVPDFARLEEMVRQIAALYDDGKNLCNRLIKNAVSAISGYVKTAGDALSNAKDIEKKGSDLMEKYSGEAIYEGLTALSEINFALPLPHTIRGTVYRRSKFDADTVREPLVGVLVEISGIVSPDADKTEADENPSCYTDSNGNFILVMPERYSLKETLRVIG